MNTNNIDMNPVQIPVDRFVVCEFLSAGAKTIESGKIPRNVRLFRFNYSTGCFEGLCQDNRWHNLAQIWNQIREREYFESLMDFGEDETNTADGTQSGT